MKILVLPREETNPYQELLYDEMRRRGARITYLAAVTPSHTLNLLLLPLEMAVRRCGGARVVHLHWVYAFALPASPKSALARRASAAWFAFWLRMLRPLGLRLVWTAHNVLPVTPVFDDDLGARRRLIAASDLVIAHSQANLDQLAAIGMPARRGAVIPHGPFIPAQPPAALRTPGDGGGPRELLFFGKIRPYKGVDILLRAFAALPPEFDAHLTVVGECGDKVVHETSSPSSQASPVTASPSSSTGFPSPRSPGCSSRPTRWCCRTGTSPPAGAGCWRSAMAARW